MDIIIATIIPAKEDKMIKFDTVMILLMERSV